MTMILALRQIVGVASLASALFAALAVQAQAPSAVTRDWTVMIYMNGKNNLEEDALNNFHAMASVGSSAQIAIVAQLGRPQVHYTAADGSWSGVYRFLIGKNQAPHPSQAVERMPAGKASDMGDPETLASFISWSKARYPARHYMVIVWNHGQGYRLMFSRLMARMSKEERASLTSSPGVANSRIGGFRAVSSDDDTKSILYNVEVQQAIARSFSSVEKLDLLGFDACLMAMLETAYGVEGHVKLMVASEELEPGDGWQYADWLGRLVANPTLTPEGLGRAIVDSYATHYRDSYFTTLSLLDLSRARPTATALTKFADNLRSAGEDELQLIRAARSDLSSYADWDNPPSYLSIDLVTLLDRYKSRTRNALLAAQADATMIEAKAMVVANYASLRSQGAPGNGLYGSQGIAIYYPASLQDFRDDYFHTGYLKANQDRPIAFVRDERWADLLYVLLDVH